MMLGRNVKAGIFLLFVLLLRRSKCLSLTCQETDRPNLDSAMVGFDPFVANTYQQYEPGFKNLIFEPTGKVFGSKFNTYSLPNEFPNYITCTLQFTSTVLTNFSHYKAEKGMRFFTTQDETDVKKHALNEVNLKDVSSDGLEEDGEEKIIREFFLATNGEIVQNKITCIGQKVTISAFARPVFTADFSAALQTLQLAADNSDPEYSKKIYRKFVDMFGTHYIKTAEMGAEIIFQKLFAEKEIDKTKHARKDCIDILARRSISSGAKSFESVISDFSELSEICGYSSEKKKYFDNSGIKSSRVIVNGPPPTGTMEQWITAVKQSPVPIRVELEHISSLFLRNGIESSFEATSRILLHNLLESEYSKYCQDMGGQHCDAENVSFGANSGYSPGSTCNNVSDTVDIGGVIITGGWSEATLSAVETINTRPLPDLPQAITHHTVSQVGSTLYNCGGVRNIARGDCYTLDLLSQQPRWESSPSLPNPIDGHSAVTIGSHIWVAHNNQLYDFSTEEQLFRTYDLPMVAPKFHCAVSNNTHSYIIGAGVDKREVWINKYCSRPEEWLLVAHLSSGRSEQGCLWFENNVFIAGGRNSGPSIGDVELLNTETNTVTATGPLLHARDSQGMFVLDGEPAVVGGHDGTRHLDTIETFDKNTNTWKANDRKLLNTRQLFGLVQLR